MNKITDFYMGNKLRVLDVSGATYEGVALAILWEDETDGEAHLSLETEIGQVEFEQSDIIDIEKIG